MNKIQTISHKNNSRKTDKEQIQNEVELLLKPNNTAVIYQAWKRSALFHKYLYILTGDRSKCEKIEIANT